MTTPIRILLDLDGVLVNFKKQYYEINGHSVDVDYKPGVPNTPEQEEKWNRFVDECGFERAEMLPDAPDLIKYLGTLTRRGMIDVIEFCTSAGGKARYADVYPQKIKWLQDHQLGMLRANITQNGMKKAECINPNYIDILIDDTPKIVDNFIKHGGYGIIHTDTNRTISQLNALLSTFGK